MRRVLGLRTIKLSRDSQAVRMMSKEVVCRKRRLLSFQIIILGLVGAILLGALLRLIVFAWALVNLDAVLCFLGKVLALFTPFLIGGVIAFLINVVLRPLECYWNKVCCKADSPCVPDSKHRARPWNSVCCGVYDDPQPAEIRR